MIQWCSAVLKIIEIAIPIQTNGLWLLQVGYSSPAESGIEDDLGLTLGEVTFT